MAQQPTSSGPIRAIVFLAVALVAGSVSLVGLYNLIASYQARIDEAKKPEDTVMAIVAARDLYQGVTITEEDLYAVSIQPRYLQDGTFLSPEHVVGRIPRERILANEFVRADRLADPESGIGLNAIIPRGMRAISVNVTDGRALSGFLNPGNYVDVLVTLGADGSRKAETVTLLQAMTVLAVNSRMGGGQQVATDRAAPSVTLAVTPEEAEKLTHASVEGNVVLTLRNDIDVTQVETHGARATSLLGGTTEEKRIEIKEWKQRSSAGRDGSLLIIKGGSTTKEKVSTGG